MNKAAQEVQRLLRTYFKRREVLQPSEWVQRHIRLNHRQSVHQGLYDLSRTPYFREIYDHAVNPAVRSLALMKSAQIGASQCISNIILYYVCNRTLPIAIVLPSQQLAQQFAERNIHNCLDTCKPLEEFVTGNPDDLKRTDLTFRSCNLKIIGGGSASKLSSNPIALVCVDECDKLETFTKEATPIELAIDRTISFTETGDSKVILSSTPTLADASEIEKHYNEGSRSKFYVPCPHCQHEQELIFEHIKFPGCKEGEHWNLHKVESQAYYECQGCKRPIEERDKAKILNLGRWVETNPQAPADAKSYHISALYSLSLSWGYVARQFLASKNDRARLQNFYNSILGLPWQPQISTVTESVIDSLVAASPAYVKGILPEKPQALFMGVDVQQNLFYWMVTAVFESGRMAIVDYGSVISFEDLAYVGQRQFRVGDTEERVGIYGAFIDAGYRSSDVYRFARDSGMFFVPAFGRTKEQKMFVPIRRSDILFDNRYLTIVHVNDTQFSNNILLNSLRVGGPESIWFPSNTCQQLKEHLTAVTIQERKDAKGFIQRDLVSKRENHLFDTLKLNLALHYMVKPELDAEQQAPANTVDATPQEKPEARYALADW